MPPIVQTQLFLSSYPMKGKTFPYLIFTVAIILLALVSCSKKEKSHNQWDIFEEMQPGYELLAFLAKNEKKDVALVSDSLDVHFKSMGFQKMENLPLIIGSDTMPKPAGSYMWKNPENGYTVFLNESQNKNDANSLWSEV